MAADGARWRAAGAGAAAGAWHASLWPASHAPSHPRSPTPAIHALRAAAAPDVYKMVDAVKAAGAAQGAGGRCEQRTALAAAARWTLSLLRCWQARAAAPHSPARPRSPAPNPPPTHMAGRAGGNVSREAGPVKGGKTVIAFVDDPTGYKFELSACVGLRVA